MLSNTYFELDMKSGQTNSILNQRTKKLLGLSFHWRMKKRNKPKQNCGSKKSNRRRKKWDQEHSGYVAKPKIKKGWRQENYCTWVAYIFRRLVLTLFKPNFFLCFQGWKNREILAFRDFFAGNNFRYCHLTEYFAGI